MRLPKPTGIKKILKNRNTLHIGIVITGIISILIFLLTYYGAYSGNFIVLIDSSRDTRSIILSETEDFRYANPRLFADSVRETPHMDFLQLNLIDAVATEGNYIDPDEQYFAYSFYLKNNGRNTIDVEARYVIEKVYRNVDEAVRVVLIINGDIDNLKYYRKLDTIPHNYNPEFPEPIEFEDLIVFREVIENFEPDQVIKFTIVSYIEGDDPDCTDDLLGGQIKMSMRFKILEPEE